MSGQYAYSDLVKVYRFGKYEWASRLSLILTNVINNALRDRGACNVLLTGGRSAEELYGIWAAGLNFDGISGVRFYFGDERCVAPDDGQSNYGLAVRTLFKSGVPLNCELYRMEAESADLERAADRYAAILPDVIDILLLSMGEDGHIASLFPNTDSLHESKRKVIPVTVSGSRQRRLTITPAVIRSAKRIFVMACGAAKADIVKQLSVDPGDYFTLPARLALRGEWILHS